MKDSKSRGYIALLLLLAVAGFVFFMSKKETTAVGSENAYAGTEIFNIDKLTSEEVVVPYVKKNKRLPDYYITKNKAREQGWVASEGNLCEVLPGKAIGGDAFSNREGNLPSASKRKWFEADLNYSCGRRNAHRLLFSNDGLIYITHDHYKTFEKR